MHTIAELPDRLEYYITRLPFAYLLLKLFIFHLYFLLLHSIVGALTHSLVFGTFLRILGGIICLKLRNYALTMILLRLVSNLRI